MNAARPLVHRGLPLLALSLSALIAVPLANAATLVSTCPEICPGATTTCSISAQFEVVEGSTLECEDLDVTVTASGNVAVYDGFFEFEVNSLTVDQSGIIRAEDSTPSNPSGSLEIVITALGDVTISGTVKANGRDQSGWITIDSGGDVTLADSGVGLAAYGVNGGDGGSVEIVAAGDVELWRPIDVASANSGNAVGGNVTIIAGDEGAGTGGDLTVHKLIDVSGYRDEGGALDVKVTGAVLFDTLGDVDASSHGEDSIGGDVTVSADSIVIDGTDISVRGGSGTPGAESYGGTVVFNAEQDIEIKNGAIIDARGGDGEGLGGGVVEIESGEGDVHLRATSKVLVQATAAGGEGGDAVISAVTVNLEGSSEVRADGGGSTGEAGTIELNGCDTDVSSGATVSATAFTGGFIVVNGFGGPDHPTDPTDTSRIFVSEFSTVDASGATTAEDGRIELRVSSLTPGLCSNDNSVECQLDTGCNNGCDTGDCLGANQNTDGVLTQFDPEPVGALPRGIANCPY